jgi:hypothetical protein
MIANTKTTGREHAYSFCYDEKTGKLYPYGECSGDKCSIQPKYCPAFKEQAHIGVNHSHPSETSPGLSIADVSVGFAARSDFDCSYSMSAHEGRCITYKDKLTPREKKDLTIALALEKADEEFAGLSNDEQNRLNIAYGNIHKLVGNKYCSYTLTERTKNIPITGGKDAGLWPNPVEKETRQKKVKTKRKRRQKNAFAGTSAAKKVNCVYSVARNNIVFCLAMAFQGNKGQMCPFAEENTGNKCPYGKPVPPREFLKNMNGNLVNAPARKKKGRK